MTQADNSVVFDETGAACVNSCRNCPFLTDSMGEHCVLRPEINMAPLWKDRNYLPNLCPLRPGGLEVRLDFTRDKLLKEGKLFPEWPLPKWPPPNAVGHLDPGFPILNSEQAENFVEALKKPDVLGPEDEAVTVIMVPPSRLIPTICKAEGLRKQVPCLYDDDAESGNGESDHCVRCHRAR